MFAVKLTAVPAQVLTEAGVIFTEGVTTGLIETVTALLVALGEVAQAALLTITTVTTSLFERLEVVKVAPVTPGILLPFTCH
jgi:hypothetical protein